LRSADVQAAVPAAAGELAPADEAAPAEEAPVAPDDGLDEELAGELDEAAVDVDDAAHPAASALTASSGTASSAFFTRLPSGRG
jgi:hypothetical protein